MPALSPLRPLLQYVVLWHSDIAKPHFDLMIETRPGSELATWRSIVWPIESTVQLTRLKDHRRIYLDFEGELSQRRGRVERVGGGACHLDIGENSIWTIQTAREQLQLRLVLDDQWEAHPC